MNSSDIQRVVIVGGGTAGWMAAAVMAKTFRGRLDIKLVESDDIGTVGVGEATIPQIKLYLQLLELDEADFLKQTNGTFKLGIQFEDWGRIGDRYLHAFGGIGVDVGGLDFYQYWLRARAMGVDKSLWDYSLNAHAANNNRFGLDQKTNAGPVQGLAYAYHFDATLFAKYLRTYSENLGVERVEGKVVDAALHPDSGFIEHVRLESGEEIAGDLFIDCSGFRSLLISQALGVGFEDWSKWLPCDSALAVPSENVEALEPYTRSKAHGAGWQWHIPLQNRCGNGHVYASAFVDDAKAADILLENLRGKALDQPRQLRFKTGRRDKFWEKNCVALGLSSGFLEPLESTAIYLVQFGLGRLLQLFPDKSFRPVDIDEYNRQMTVEMEMIRDFIILHYCATERDDTEFWRYCRSMSLPDRLAHKLELFKSAGRVFRESEELFAPVSWLQVMLGQGVIPERYHPLAEQLDDKQLLGYLEKVEALITSSAGRLPDHGEFVAQYCSSVR
ncbi:tryptophan halogenase family protein [Microbulbifer agarilyticus]